MKGKLKSNQGFALTGVLCLIAILTLFGTAMYTYSMQALKTIEYGTNRQKADYIARSGIEAAVFMYQDTLLKEGTEADEGDILSSFITASSEDGNNATDKTITTNWVYMLRERDAYGHIQYVDGGNGAAPSPISKDYVGYFRVTITNDSKTYDMPVIGADGQPTTEQKTEYIKRFKSVAYAGTKIATKNAYIVPVVDISNKGWVTDEGIINLENCTTDETSVIYSTTISIDCGLIDKLSSTLYEIFGIGSSTGKRLENVPVNMGITSGNMVISVPKDSDTLSFKCVDGTAETGSQKDNVAGFISLSDLFISPNIDVKPDKARFNMLYLRGNNIVLDGEMELYVYDPGINYSKDQSSNNFFVKIISSIQAIAAKLGKNYRLGTVILGTPSTITTTVTDPMPSAVGGLGKCGKVFFGGDVYVNVISTQGTRKYKLFTAGDVCYFDGDFEISGNAYGVDLVKYFLDTARSRGYSGTVLQQFERTRDFYYNTDSYAEEYTKDSMRKITLNERDAGGVDWDSIEDIVVPSSGDTAYIIWD